MSTHSLSTTDTSGPSPLQRRRYTAGLICAQTVSLLAILFVLFDGWRRDWHVPLLFSNDALAYLLQSKGTVENGWWWFHPRLAAPWGFNLLAFPENTNVDQAIVWLISLFSNDVGLCVNVAWITFVVAAGVIAMGCFMTLGLGTAWAMAAGILFALSPYALARSTDHFSLAPYLIPIPCTAALLVATNQLRVFRSSLVVALATGGVLLGLNYIYYAFFGCFLLLVALITAFVRDRKSAAWLIGLFLVATTCAAAALNLAPSFIVWSQQGKPQAIVEKLPAEAELYGLTLRQLVGPVSDHTIPMFRRWRDMERAARFPLENSENRSARLGLLGAIGFVLLMGSLVVSRHSRHEDPLLNATAGLALGAVLLGTVGGFGSLFNLLVSPDIRAYSRLVPFIHFFSLLGLARFIERGFHHSTAWSRRPWPGVIATVGLLAVGIYDQGHETRRINNVYEANLIDLSTVRTFVTALENRLPAGAAVFQLPVREYPVDEDLVLLPKYDQVKPYLVSHTLRWSYPAFSDALARWQHQVGNLPLRELVAAVKVAGFSAVLVDLRGYEDHGKSVLSQVERDFPSAVAGLTERYVAFNLADVSTEGTDMSRLPRLSPKHDPATARLSQCSALPPNDPTLSIDQVGSATWPFETVPVQAPWWGDITISGWAVDAARRTRAWDVDVVLGKRVFPTHYGIPRNDVATAFREPRYVASGFTARIPRYLLGAGVHELSLRVVSADGSCYLETRLSAIEVR